VKFDDLIESGVDNAPHVNVGCKTRDQMADNRQHCCVIGASFLDRKPRLVCEKERNDALIALAANEKAEQLRLEKERRQKVVFDIGNVLSL
jgi:hypothetical protein